VRLAVAVLAGLVLPPPALSAAAGSDPGAGALLRQSAAASESLSYAGTKYVAAWRPGATSSSLVDVRHEARAPLTVERAQPAAASPPPPYDDGVVLSGATLDSRLIGVLGAAYDLRLAGTGRCAGRDADVVEARRPGSGAVAGRFWLDAQTHLLLRREVYDDAGRRVRSSAFLDLQVAPADPVVPAAATRSDPARDSPDRVPRAEIDRLRAAGWPLPTALPGGFVLFDARSRSPGEPARTGRVLQLAYTDGLSTMSLFVQRGGLGRRPPAGFAARDVAGRPVWAREGVPERLVWAGGGRVLTLVSDAPDAAVVAAVAALPHDPPPDPGLLGRLRRGVSRLASWLNPFD
jgi:sigma-E factor negative regulatory protein RseB